MLYESCCLEAMGGMDAESVDLTFTSPPYFNARDYAQYASYDAYLDFLADAFAHVLRLTKPGRYLVVNTSPVIVPRPVDGSSSESTRLAIPFDLHARLQEVGWQFAEDIVWRKPLGAVPRRRGVWLRFKRSPLTWKPDLVTEYLLAYRKPQRLTRDCLADYDADTRAASAMPEEFEPSNVWDICPASDKRHPAIFPAQLAERVVQAYSMRGDTVLDPFAGIGTVGAAARKLGRRAILVERDAEYAAVARERCNG